MVLLLIVMMVTIAVVSLSVALVTETVLANLRQERGELAQTIAESGAEEAVLRVLRDPTTQGSFALTVGEGSATVEIVGTTIKTIYSKGSVSGYERQVEVEVAIVEGQVEITKWRGE